MILYAISTRIFKSGDNLIELILKSIEKQKLRFEDNDVLVLTSKIISYAQNRLVKLRNIKPSDKAKKLGKYFSIKSEFAELILNEADEIYGGVNKAILTLKNEILTINAGIDQKNVPHGYALLWPKEVKKWALKIKNEIKNLTGKTVAILIIDSGLFPLRTGTTGLALAVAGFNPIKNLVGKKDIYGKKIIMTQHAIADDLASAAHLLMGENAERKAIVLIRNAPLFFNEKTYDFSDIKISKDKCIFMNRSNNNFDAKKLSKKLNSKKLD